MADKNEVEVPFQPFGVDSKTAVAGMKETGGNGVSLSKTKLIILTVVVLILLVLVIVLAVLLGHERASKERAKRYRSGMEQDTDPTSVGPTTPGPEPWWSIRLPDDVIPYHYDLTLYVNLTKPIFKGKTKIWVNVTNSTSYILVHAVNMNFTTVEVKTLLGGIVPIKSHFPFDKNQFYVIELDSSLDKGRYTVALGYTGEYADNLRGMYKASFFYQNGTESFYSATQFEPLSAREAFPCFDEPALKATFNVTLAHDPRLISLSNMPIYHSHEKDGWKYDHFGKTVKMSTYLAAFFVGDFKYKELTAIREVNMKMYARGDVIDQVDYALSVSNKTMTYFEDFFGIPYSLPKSDSVALPVFGPSGMENWGLIKYRETSLLLKEGETSSAAKESIVKLVAHEIAHQWFGNIVTMEWWTDLWLNEGFATYASAIGVDHVHPEWNIIDQFIVRAVQDSLELDGFSNSRAIRIPISDPKRINEVFDAISYKKGASLVLMVHYFLGTPTFRDGLRKYLTDHAFGNAETNDLWDAMTAASHNAGKDINVRETMHNWTGQMGYPVVTLKPSSTPNMYTVTQERFLYYKDPNATQDESSPFGYQWAIPFTYYTATTISRPVSKKVMDKKSDEIPWNGGWIKANVGQTGFYRVNYDEKNWNLLTQQLKFDHKILDATDRAGLIDDSFNLARANLLHYTTAFEISTYLTKEVDYVPWLSAIRKFQWIMDILPPTRPATKYLKKYVAYITKAEYDKLRMKDEGNHLDKFKRTILIDANCAAGVLSCKTNMTQMYRAWMEDPIKNAVPPDLKALVYHFGIVFGSVEEWDFAYNQFKSTNVVSDMKVLLYAMAGAQEPWIIQRYLSYILDPEKIGPRYARTVVYYITDSNPVGTNEVWNFFQLKWEQISKYFGGAYQTLSYFIPQGTKRLSTEFQLQQVQEFMESKDDGESLPWSVHQAIERVKANVQWRKTHEQVIESWLKTFFAKLPGSNNNFNLGFSDPEK